MKLDRSYRDIPGTYVFDIEHSQKGYYLNKFCYSLNKKKNRDEFAHDENAYLDLFAMTKEQKKAVQNRNFNKMLELGGNIYFIWKIAATMSISMQKAGGMMSLPQITEEDFQKIMLSGGRDIMGNIKNKGKA